MWLWTKELNRQEQFSGKGPSEVTEPNCLTTLGLTNGTEGSVLMPLEHGGTNHLAGQPALAFGRPHGKAMLLVPLVPREQSPAPASA